jgi:hypothetical protein
MRSRKANLFITGIAQLSPKIVVRAASFFLPGARTTSATLFFLLEENGHTGTDAITWLLPNTFAPKLKNLVTISFKELQLSLAYTVRKGPYPADHLQ